MDPVKVKLRSPDHAPRVTPVLACLLLAATLSCGDRSIDPGDALVGSWRRVGSVNGAPADITYTFQSSGTLVIFTQPQGGGQQVAVSPYRVDGNVVTITRMPQADGTTASVECTIEINEAVLTLPCNTPSGTVEQSFTRVGPTE